MAKPDGLSATNNYVIITTKNIVTASKKLNSFVAHKQAQGYSVLVVTEAQYGVTQFPAPGRIPSACGSRTITRPWGSNTSC